MKECGRYRELISVAVDGELSEAQETELNEHINDCHECDLLYSAFKTLSQGIKETETVVPELLAPGIMYKIGLEKNRKKRGLLAFGRFTATAAIIAVVTFVAFRVYSPGRSLYEDVKIGSNPYTAQVSLAVTSGVSDEAAESSAFRAYGESGTSGINYVKSFVVMPNAYIQDRAGMIIVQNNYEHQYALAIVDGSIPEEFKNYQLVYRGKNELHFQVLSDEINRLNESETFTELLYIDSSSDYGIVVVFTERGNDKLS